MPTIDDYGRPEPPPAAGEVETLLGFLDYQRATLAWKTRGLDAEGFGTKVAASSMTLGGILKHLATVEDVWFTHYLHDGLIARPDWDGDWSPQGTPEELVALWQAAVERSRAGVATALADGGLDRLAAVTWPDGTAMSLRWIVVHMIEEYARHNGHADLIRESIDGETGE